MSYKIKVNVKLKKIHEKAIVPEYKTIGSSGADLHALIPLNDSFKDPNEYWGYTIQPNEIAVFKTGLKIELPEGYEAQVRSRGGLATKGIFVTNSPGTVDEDYRGEIMVILCNNSKEPFSVYSNDRIAQLVVSPYIQANFELSEELTDTDRGEGRFGHTGSN